MGVCGSSEDVDEKAQPPKFNGGPPVMLTINEKHLEMYDSLNTPVDKDELVVDDIGVDFSESGAPVSTEVGEPEANPDITEGNGEENGDSNNVTPECKYIEGYLKKKSPGILGGWQIRFCVLQNNSILSYYGAEIDFKSNREAKGSLIITEIAEAARNRLLSEEDTDDSIPILLIPIGDRVYEFQGEDESITLLWHETILSHF